MFITFPLFFYYFMPHTLLLAMHYNMHKDTYDDINHTPGYQVKIRNFVQLFILFFGTVFWFINAKYLCRMHNKMFKSSYSV